MEENLGEIIFDIMTNEYKDKVDKNKDIVDYLKDKYKKWIIIFIFVIWLCRE